MQILRYQGQQKLMIQYSKWFCRNSNQVLFGRQNCYSIMQILREEEERHCTELLQGHIVHINWHQHMQQQLVGTERSYNWNGNWFLSLFVGLGI